LSLLFDLNEHNFHIQQNGTKKGNRNLKRWLLCLAVGLTMIWPE